MAGSLNRVQLIGNVGADPEIRSMNNGSKVANFRIATSESWKDKNTGEKKERTEWHSIVVWNDGLVGVIGQYVKKGSKVMVEGQLQTRKWEKDGADRYSTEVVLQGFGGSLLLLGDPAGGGGQTSHADRDERGTPHRARSTAGNGAQGGAQGGGTRELDDEIPF